MKNKKLNFWFEYNDLKEILIKYNFFDKHKFYYYQRKDQIGNLIYDHFFQTMYNRLSRPINDKNKDDLMKSIAFCNTDYLYTIEDSKVSFNFTKRTFFITNFYNILLYEIYVNKIFKSIINIINNRSYNNYLIDGKYFWYFRVFDFDIHTWNTKSYQHYFDSWNEFEIRKKELIGNYDYYIETDLKSFYDTIDHDKLIWLLSEFSKIHGTKNTDSLMYKFTNILFKVNWYRKIWLPQWIMASDILSSIFIWLNFFLYKDLNWFEVKNWVYYLKDNICFLHYNDDFVFFSNDKIKLERRFNTLIKDIFINNWLSINIEKTSNVTNTRYYNNHNNIDFWLIKKSNPVEIEKLLNEILDELKKDTNKIDLNKLKRYYKWFNVIYELPKTIQATLFDDIFHIFIKKDEANTNVKKFFILLIIHPKNFIKTIFSIEKIVFEPENKTCENLLINNYFKNNLYLLSDSILLKLFVWLKGLKFNLISNLLEKELRNRNNKVVVSFIDNEKKILKWVIKDNWLIWLHNLFYRDYWNFKLHDNIQYYSEDILSIKLYALFGVKVDTKFLWNYLKNHAKDNIKWLSHEINIILDELIVIKNIFTNYYFKNPSFLADLYSFLNILMTLLFHIKDNKVAFVKINWGSQPGMININLWNSEKTSSIREHIKNFDMNASYLFFYISKKRAELNHKEVNGIWNAIDTYIYHKYDDVDIFHTSINHSITYIINLIKEDINNLS